MGAAEVQLLREMVDLLAALPGALRQTVLDQQWSKIPLDVYEENYSASLAIGTPLVVPPQLNDLVRIDRFVVAVPAGATGLVQLGSSLIPVSPGVSSIALGKLMRGEDNRTLTLAGAAGPASLILIGQQVGAEGIMSL